jgi:hypothetical protein
MADLAADEPVLFFATGALADVWAKAGRTETATTAAAADNARSAAVGRPGLPANTPNPRISKLVKHLVGKSTRTHRSRQRKNSAIGSIG